MKKFIICLLIGVSSFVPVSFADVPWRSIARFGGVGTAVAAGVMARFLYKKIQYLEAKLVRSDDAALKKKRLAYKIALGGLLAGGGSVLASFLFPEKWRQGTAGLKPGDVHSGVINFVAPKPADSSTNVPLMTAKPDDAGEDVVSVVVPTENAPLIADDSEHKKEKNKKREEKRKKAKAKRRQGEIRRKSLIERVAAAQEPKVIKIIVNVLPQGNFFDDALPLLQGRKLDTVDGVTFFSQQPFVSRLNLDSLARCDAALKSVQSIGASDFNAVFHEVKIRGDGHCAAHAYVFLKKYKDFSVGAFGLPYAFIATVNAVTKVRQALFEVEYVQLGLPQDIAQLRQRILMNGVAVPPSSDYPDIPKPVDSCFDLDSDDIDAASQLLKKKIIIWTSVEGSFQRNTFIDDDELIGATMQQYFHVLNHNRHWSVLMLKPLSVREA